MKKLLFISLLLVAVFGLSGCGKKAAEPAKPTASSTNESLFFYSPDCPHCQNVESFMATNKIGEHYTFKYKDVKGNKDSANLFLEKIKECNLEKKEYGVPLLYDGGQCYMGDEPIINHLKKLLGL